MQPKPMRPSFRLSPARRHWFSESHVGKPSPESHLLEVENIPVATRASVSDADLLFIANLPNRSFLFGDVKNTTRTLAGLVKSGGRSSLSTLGHLGLMPEWQLATTRRNETPVLDSSCGTM